MANEARLQVSLGIRKGNLTYQNQPTAFLVTLDGSGGPTPGTISVSTTGTNVDLSQLATPGLCVLRNLDEDNYVEWGVHDGAVFHPVGEILPGETYAVRLSRNLGEEEDVPGTGTTGDVNTLYLRANTATCLVTVDTFEA